MSDKMDTEARKMYDDAIEVIIIHWVLQHSGTIFNDFKEIKLNIKKKKNLGRKTTTNHGTCFDYVSFKKSSDE